MQQPCRGGSAASRRSCLVLLRDVGDLLFLDLPLSQQGADNHRVDDPHDLVAVGIVRAELRALVRVKATFKKRAAISAPVQAPCRSGSDGIRNSPPLNHATASKPIRARGHGAKQVAGEVANSVGREAGASG